MSFASGWRALLAFSVALASVQAALACSDDESTLAPRGDGGAPSDAAGADGPDDGKPSPQAYADALCAFYDKCDPIYLKVIFGDIATCRTRVLVRTTDSLSAPGNVVTRDQLTACTTKLGATCGDNLFTLPECDFRGTLDDGAPCAYPGQCKGGSCLPLSVDGGAAACGTCSTRLVEGGDCRRSECRPGLACTADGRCAKTGSTGEPCDATKPCRSDLQCAADGKCAAQLGPGASCTPSAPTPCDVARGLNCIEESATTGTCKENAYATLGGKCGFDATAHLFTSCLRSYCSTGVGTDRTCTARKPTDAPCLNDDECTDGHYCENSVCRPANTSVCK